MLTYLAVTLIVLGIISILVGIAGIYRFPDALTRIHASSLIDNIGMILVLLGIALLQPHMVHSFKILFMIGIIFLLSPVSSHAIAKSIYLCLKEKKDNDGIYD